MNKIKELEIKRDKLRKEIRNKHISIWKFWQGKKDRELVRKEEKICQINDILYGVRLQKQFANEVQNE